MLRISKHTLTGCKSPVTKSGPPSISRSLGVDVCFYMVWEVQVIPPLALRRREHSLAARFLSWNIFHYQSFSKLNKINPECSLEGLMLKVKLQYFGHLMQRTDSLEKTLKLEKMKAGREGDDRGWGGWTASPIQWTRVWASSRSW